MCYLEFYVFTENLKTLSKLSNLPIIQISYNLTIFSIVNETYRHLEIPVGGNKSSRYFLSSLIIPLVVALVNMNTSSSLKNQERQRSRYPLSKSVKKCFQ